MSSDLAMDTDVKIEYSTRASLQQTRINGIQKSAKVLFQTPENGIDRVTLTYLKNP